MGGAFINWQVLKVISYKCINQHPQSLPRGGEDERLEQADLMATTRHRPRTMRRIVQLTLDGEKAEARCT